MKVILDLGNSQTRVIIEKEAEKTYKEIELPNYFVEFDTNETVTKEDDFVFTINSFVNRLGIVGHPKISLPITLGSGKTAEIQYSERIERPGYMDKVLQRNTYYSIALAVVNAMNCNGVTSADIDLTVLLPLKEVTRRAKELEECLNGIFELEWEGRKYTAGVTLAHIVGEDQAAVLAAFYGMDGKMKTDMAPYKEGDLIAFDIGAGTFNIVCFKNLTFIEGKKDTYAIGGNTIRELFIEKYEKEYGFKPNLINAEIACITGWIKQGTKNIDVRNLVNASRKEAARTMESQAKQFFTRTQVNLSEVPLFLYLGGNAMKDVEQKGEQLIPAAQYLQELLKPITKYSEHYIPEAPRSLNVRGGWIYAKIMDKMKKRG